MIYLGLLTVLAIAMIVIFEKTQKSDEKFQWHNLTLKQHIVLSTAFAALIQFLFITVIPGWIVTAVILGKGSFYETSWGNEIWGVVVMFANTTFYFFIFYLLLGWISNRQKKKMGESDSDLLSIYTK